MIILKKKNIIFKILLKCVENFSIDQEFKDQAKEMILNTVQYNRAKFLTEEKEEMEGLWESLKFRLKNIQEVENHNVLDELISDNGLPTDDPILKPFHKEQLILTKTEIHNIVKTLQNSILDYSKQNQLSLPKQNINDNKEDNIVINQLEINNETDINKNYHQEAVTFYKIKTKKQRQSKVKKSNKRKSKSMKINHVLI
jgi:hypothetical protein